jgi:hypothetical protein
MTENYAHDFLSTMYSTFTSSHEKTCSTSYRSIRSNVVQSMLEKLPYMESFHTAEETGGGWGATIVELKK